MNSGIQLIMQETNVYLEEEKSISEENRELNVIIIKLIFQFKQRIVHALRLIGNVMLDSKEMYILTVFLWKRLDLNNVKELIWKVKDIEKYQEINVKMGILLYYFKGILRTNWSGLLIGRIIYHSRYKLKRLKQLSW